MSFIFCISKSTFNIPTSSYDFVVESKIPTTEDSSWYRVYKSGWVEQGGIISNSGGNTYITFGKAFTYTNYTFLVTPASKNSQNGFIYWSVSDRTTTSVRCMLVGNSNVPIGSTISWEAKGQGTVIYYQNYYIKY